MDQDIKRHIMNIMKEGTGGCKHLEMTEALNCSICQMKMVKAQSEYNRLRKEYPEKFIQKEIDDGYDIKTQNLGQMLDDRIAQDKLYREHLRLLACGTQEEKIRETKREQNGFYKRNVGDNIRRIL